MVLCSTVMTRQLPRGGYRAAWDTMGYWPRQLPRGASVCDVRIREEAERSGRLDRDDGRRLVRNKVRTLHGACCTLHLVLVHDDEARCTLYYRTMMLHVASCITAQ